MCNAVTYRPGGYSEAPCVQTKTYGTLDLCYYHNKMLQGVIEPFHKDSYVRTADNVPIYEPGKRRVA
jgi:hypothetical protein